MPPRTLNQYLKQTGVLNFLSATKQKNKLVTLNMSELLIGCLVCGEFLCARLHPGSGLCCALVLTVGSGPRFRWLSEQSRGSQSTSPGPLGDRAENQEISCDALTTWYVATCGKHQEISGEPDTGFPVSTDENVRGHLLLISAKPANFTMAIVISFSPSDGSLKHYLFHL